MAAAMGCLILHGFTSSLDCVRPLVPMAELLGMPYRMPVLRGHGTRPEELRGVQAADWYADAQRALNELHNEAEQVVVCGLSMGGLLALQLAAEQPTRVGGIVTIAAALRFVDPLARFSPALARLVPMSKIDARKAFADQQLAASSTNYPHFPTATFVSLYRYTAMVRTLLPQVKAPLLVLHSKRDRVIKPSSAQTIYDEAGSQRKELHWFERSGHEMLQDCEAGAVVAATESFIRQLRVPVHEAEW
ncbi:MAG: alpha/beta fold hydrolase [Herpetosiphonaceae bacterium]|nr:alpha/beta fold hydrolase [Herpetosiphonaceae bacterium]